MLILIWSTNAESFTNLDKLNDCLVFGSNQLSLQPQLLQKKIINSKMVKIDAKRIILLRFSKIIVRHSLRAIQKWLALHKPHAETGCGNSS